MRIGVLSDSHGRIEATARAVERLRDAGAEVLVHLGDVESEAVLEELVGSQAYVVFGNCDWDLARLDRYARALGLNVAHPMGWIEAAGKRVAFTHGHLGGCMREAVAAGADYLLHGHTHELRDEFIGSTRVINPGALFRATRYTAVILDLTIDSLEVIEVPRGA